MRSSKKSAHGRPGSCWVLLLLFLAACSQEEHFFEFRSFREAQWDQQEAVRFEVPVHDISSPYDIFLEIRNTNDYPFRNIWLFVDCQTPHGATRADTVQVELADLYGKWYGKGLSLYTLSVPYDLHVQYPDTGVYIYTIRQGMRENPLRGISDMGLRVLTK